MTIPTPILTDVQHRADGGYYVTLGGRAVEFTDIEEGADNFRCVLCGRGEEWVNHDPDGDDWMWECARALLSSPDYPEVLCSECLESVCR